MSRFGGLTGSEWLLLLSALQAALLVPDAFIGHYRSGFALRAQYFPLVLGVLMSVAAVVTVAVPTTVTRAASLGLGVTGAGLSIAGLAYHHWYGITTKPGGYRWLLHHLMHHAPPLAPIALGVAGAFQALGAWGSGGHQTLGGTALRVWLLATVGVGLGAMTLQSGLLHFRGAYNNVVMYLPVVVLPVAAAAAGWSAITEPGGRGTVVAAGVFHLTFLVGFVGAGMHLRGMDRQMGGLYMRAAAVLDAPPPGAPLHVATLAAGGLVGVHML